MIAGCGCDTPAKSALLLFAPVAQQLAIAATHQRNAALDQANGAIAEIVGFPGTLGDALLTEQHFGDRTIGTAVHAPIERTNRQNQAFAALRR